MKTRFEDTLAYFNIERLSSNADNAAAIGHACRFVVETDVRGEKLTTTIHAGTEQSQREPVQKVLLDALRDLDKRGNDEDRVKCSFVMGGVRVTLVRVAVCGSEDTGDRRIVAEDTTCESFVFNNELVLISYRRAEHRIIF